MTQCDSVNVKLSNSQINKLKLGIKNGTEVTLNLSSNVIGVSNDENNFPHKLLLTDRHISKLHKAFANNLSANIKLPKIQISKMVQSAGTISLSDIRSPKIKKVEEFAKNKDFLKSNQGNLKLLETGYNKRNKISSVMCLGQL